MFKKKNVYINQRKKGVNVWVVGIVMLIIGITWTNNWYMYQDLQTDYNKAITIYNTAVNNRSSGTSVQSVQDTPEQDGTNVQASQNGIEEASTLPLSMEDKIRQTFPENADVMLAIAKAENRTLNPTPTPNQNNDGSQDCGLMQINSIHGYSCDWLENIDNNLQVARQIYDTQGTTAWSTYNSGKYLEFLVITI